MLSAAMCVSLVMGACSSDPPVEAPEPVTSLPNESIPTVLTLPPVPTVPPVGSLVPADEDPMTFYVSPTLGRDDNDGQTKDTAWASLQTALDRLSPGQTLFLMGGAYQGEIQRGLSHFLLTVSGTPDAWIRVTAAPGEAPTLIAEQGNALEISGSYVEISGLEVLGQGFGAGNDYGWGLLVRNNHHVRLLGNEISGMPVGGITSVEASNFEVVANVVHDNSFWGTEQGSGISMWHSVDAGTEPADDGYHNRIIGNIAYRNENKVFSEWRDYDVITDGNGIIIDQADETGYTGRTLVANNIVFDNGGRGILVLESSRVDVVHNTTFHNGRTEGLEGGSVELAAGRAHDVRFLNNLAWSRPGSPAATVVETTNIVSGGNVFVTDSQSGTYSESDLVITNDPGVVLASVDPTVADFRPRPDSRLIGRALTVAPALSQDADLRRRPSVGADVGAYELTRP